MMRNLDLSVVLLHEGMEDKQGDIVTTSITLIDVHDIARSSRTFGATNFFVAHPSPALQKLCRTIKGHWEEGHGAEYNPNRKEALSYLSIASNLDEVIQEIDRRSGKLPLLIATSAKSDGPRTSFKAFRETACSDQPYLLMLGTGHGMSEGILKRSDLFLEPIKGNSDYNHLSVRSAAALLLNEITRKD